MADPELAATAASERAPPGEVFARGALVGRYVILDRLGSGAMGIVFGAYDPELDRKIALKFLKSGEGDFEARARLLREAQAMAKLAHPNVITVHDVGTVGDEVFVAMEFVQGVTLKQWLQARPRGWREVVDVFAAAGRGLAAAHDAGLVHRDLKPDNIMIGSDGRVRVMDFGLARASTSSARAGDELASNPREQALALELTRIGSLVGTPSYMAPEQWERSDPDARSDQFSFCVALWEAVYGERPFRGETILALMLAITQGERTPPRDPGRAPEWLRELLERGLAVVPSARWSAMTELCAALEQRPDPSGQRRERIVIGALIAGTMLVLESYSKLFRGSQEWTYMDTLLPAVVTVVSVAAATFYYRNTLFRNPFHRARLLTVLMTALFILASRLAGARSGEDLASVAVRDVMLCGVGLGVTLVWVTPRTWLTWLTALIPALGTAAVVVSTENVVWAVMLSLNLPIFVFLADWLTSGRRESAVKAAERASVRE